MGRGSLTVVGTGIRLAGQITAEARAALERADEVLYLVADPLAGAWIASLNPSARSLAALYRPGERRAESYSRIVGEIVTCVRREGRVCAAFYGHPGVLVRPAHEAIRQLRSEGFDARMLPAISAEDCLFADLGFDPGEAGWQSYEATDFLVRRRSPDPSASLILWQVGALGNVHAARAVDTSRLPLLVDFLLCFYPHFHETVLYEASPYAVCSPLVRRFPLSELPATEITAMTTLYVPPAASRPVDPEMADRLGIPGP